MPTVSFDGVELDCDEGRILRDVLLERELSPHNGRTNYLNCSGKGLCGTCAVEVDGDVNKYTDTESRRLSLPPHDPEAGLRLACQTQIQGDVEVTKHEGICGQRKEE